MRIQRQSENFSWRFARSYSEDEWRSHLAQVEGLLGHLHDLRVDNRTAFGKIRGKRFEPTDRDRMMQYDKIFDILRNTGGPENMPLSEYPKEYQALLMAGVGGAGKGTALKNKALQAMLDPRLHPDRHFIINPDDTKQIMASLGMIPSADEIRQRYDGLELPGWDDLSPMERSPFIHEEASWLTKEFAKKLRQEGYNIAYDGTLGNPQKAADLVNDLRKDGYKPENGGFVNLNLVDTDPEIGLGRARERHRGGQKLWTPGQPFPEYADHDKSIYKLLGGRALPSFIHAENNAPPGSRERSAPAAIYGPTSQLTDSSLRLNGDANLPRDGSIAPQIMDARGPSYEGLNGRMGRRMTASEGAEFDQFMDEWRSRTKQSVRGIVESFENGEIDYPTLVSMIIQRVEFVDQEESDRPYHDSSEGGHDYDDVSPWLRDAVRSGALAQEQMDEIIGLVFDV
jgi:hypothetical protein